ncbi:MAG TPA: NnrU family protein [Geminicoccaceae bacterium]|nr:NnrU family protein [Geminicoccaceae bacterium]
MGELIAAAAFLLVTHFGVSSTGLRGALVGRLGEGPYLGLYSLVALAALAWLILAYAGAPYVELWPPAAWTRWVAFLVMPVAALLVVAGLSGPNPTAVGQGDALDAEDPARGVVRITRHPFLWGVGLWALSHVVPNGDLASLVFFGAFAALALVGTALIDAKRARREGERWERFRRMTSNLPFAAILSGRQRLVWGEIGLGRTAGALALWIVLLAVHPYLFGVSPLPA